MRVGRVRDRGRDGALVGPAARAQGRRTAGRLLSIPSGVRHVVMNGSDTEPAVAVLARTDPNEQEDVTPLPGLDDLAHLRAGH